MKNLLFLLCILFLASCVEKKRQQTEEAESAFTLPAIPSILTTKSQQVDFLAENYWTNFNFKDTTQLRLPQYMDQLFVNYLGFLSQAPSAIGVKSIKQMMTKAETDSVMFNYFISLSDKYLGDPNSLIRNEPLYMVVLEKIIASDRVSNTYKIRYRHRYELTLKNRLGEKATNFRYTLKNGKQKMMHEIKISYLLLFFNNPDCNDCKNVKQQMISSPIINNLQHHGKLKILSLYPDKELDIWYKHYTKTPVTWINAYDKGAVIEGEELYDLKAIPTLYLLDKEKRLILKDARFEEIEQWLSTKNRQSL
jgi:thioredoxin-related protein